MIKHNLIWLLVLLIGAVLIGYSLMRDNDLVNDLSDDPSPSISVSPSPSVSAYPHQSPLISNTPTVEASCELRGEIRFLSANLYDNQDAKFIYKGIDQPGRNIFWTIIPHDNLSVGPNIFNKLPLPDGESLLGIVLPAEPKSKVYELTAKIQYGKLIGGTVKVFEKQCVGKTTVVLP